MPMNYDKLFQRLGNTQENNGVTTYTLRKKKQLSESTLQRMRENKPVRMEIICRLCYLLKCQPGDIMTYIPDKADMSK